MEKSIGKLLGFLMLPFLFLFLGMARAQGEDKFLKTVLSADGPYICYFPDNQVRILQVTENGTIDSVWYDHPLPSDYSFPVVSHDGKYTFQVTLHPIKRQPWKRGAADKVFVMSDPHGNLDCVVSLLQANHVIDSNLSWCFGKNQLMVLGDVCDRGNDVTQIFWLLYKLEAEAEMAGGQVSFILGNHEPMVLSDDLRYTKDKYKALADSLHIGYSSLYGSDTELGRWLATRNVIQILGDNLYVHAGLGSAFYNADLSVPDVNDEMSRVLFLKNKKRKEFSDLHAFLYGNEGPIWYRGLVRDKEKYKPCPADTLQLLMKKYGVEHIIVGHTIFDDISTFYDGKVIGVNVDNLENREAQRGRSILIENGRYYVVGDKGKIRLLFE